MIPRLLCTFGLVGMLAMVANAQNGAPMQFSSVGTPQTVPPPVGVVGETGNMDMIGRWYNALQFTRLLIMSVRYIPSTYAENQGENLTLAMQFGSASLPGTPFQQAHIYVPLGGSLIIHQIGSVGWNGPGDTATPTNSGGTGAPCPFITDPNCGYGGRFSINVPAALSGVPLTAQYFLHDPARNRYYSSNALNMTAP